MGRRCGLRISLLAFAPGELAQSLCVTLHVEGYRWAAVDGLFWDKTLESTWLVRGGVAGAIRLSIPGRLGCDPADGGCMLSSTGVTPGVGCLPELPSVEIDGSDGTARRAATVLRSIMSSTATDICCDGRVWWMKRHLVP